jgi:hypothetical protein
MACRIAPHEGNIDLDLADADWWEAAIGLDSWRMVAGRRCDARED